MLYQPPACSVDNFSGSADDFNLISNNGHCLLQLASYGSFHVHGSFGDISFGAASPRVYNGLPPSLPQDISHKKFMWLLETLPFGSQLTTVHCDMKHICAAKISLVTHRVDCWSVPTRVARHGCWNHSTSPNEVTSIMDLGLVHKKTTFRRCCYKRHHNIMLSYLTANDKRQDGGHRGVVFGLFVCWWRCRELRGCRRQLRRRSCAEQK